MPLLLLLTPTVPTGVRVGEEVSIDLINNVNYRTSHTQKSFEANLIWSKSSVHRMEQTMKLQLGIFFIFSPSIDSRKKYISA